jgi:hypothetical protein
MISNYDFKSIRKKSTIAARSMEEALKIFRLLHPNKKIVKIISYRYKQLKEIKPPVRKV